MNTNGKKEQAGWRVHRGQFAMLVLAAILALPTAGTAQGNVDERGGFWTDPHGEFFVYGEGAVSVGGLHSYAGLGRGLGAGGTLFLNRARNAALRVEGNLNAYDGRFNHPPHSTMGPSDLRVRTDITILSAGIGPQVYLLTGAVRPYVYGTLGVAKLVGDMNVRGHLDQEALDRSINLDGIGVALSAGGGLSVQVRRGNRPVAVDVSVSYRNNGIADHLDRPFSARQQENGDGTRVGGDHHHGGQASGDHHYGGQIIFPHMVNDFDFVSWRIGVTFGLG